MSARLARVVPITCGILLTLYAGLQIWIDEQPYDSPVLHPVCALGVCPDEFTPGRLFYLRQQLLLHHHPAVLARVQRGLRFDPADAYRWADLGDAEAAMQQWDQANYCFRQAVIRAPRSPAILFRSANFAFAHNDPARVLENLRVVLSEPELARYYDSIYLTYSRLNVPMAEILQNGFPLSPAPARDFLHFMENRNDVAAAGTIWHWMASHSLEDDPSTSGYLWLLIGKHQVDAAAKLWKQYVQAPKYLETDWLYNSGFEHSPRASPFDWAVESVRRVSAGVAHSACLQGNGCVRLDFLGDDNVDYRGTYQFAAVTPGKWKLTGYMRTDHITTDQGPTFHVLDIRNEHALDVWTDSMTGSHPWTQQQIVFDVKPGTDIVRIDIVRRISLHFDNKITGTAWVDDLKLAPMR